MKIKTKLLIKNKIFIVVFTAIITILAIIYVSFKTQIYEVKSVVKIGHIKNNHLVYIYLVYAVLCLSIYKFIYRSSECYIIDT